MNSRRLVTVRSSKEIDRIFTQGRRVSGPLLSLLVMPSPPAVESGRLAFIAGKKLGNAVLRNRCRRVMREAVRSAGGPWPGWDVAVIARREVASAASGEVGSALAKVIAKAGVAT